MFAVVKDEKVIGFLLEESQKLDFDPNEYSFIEFEWEWPTDNPPMVSDAIVANGKIEWTNRT